MIKLILSVTIAASIWAVFLAVCGRLVAGPIPKKEKPHFFKRVLKLTFWIWGTILIVGAFLCMGFVGIIAILILFLLIKETLSGKQDESLHYPNNYPVAKQ
jgi:hypothetical protein